MTPRLGLALLALLSTVLSVLLAVMVNVATGGALPPPLSSYQYLAWPAIGLLAVVTMGIVFWQLLLQRGTAGDLAPEPDSDRLTGPPAELPPDNPSFTGRAAELARLRSMLPAEGAGTAGVICAVAGKPGVGKSTLAIHFAHQLRGRYPDAQLYVNLHGAGLEPVTPSEALGRFLRALGVAGDELQGEEEELAARYRTRLAGKRALVLLDDAMDETQVRSLLPGSPTCVTLVTSRRPLVGIFSSGQLLLDVMDEEEAVAMLAAIAGDRVTADPAAAITVARQCGHLPLALGIAGARLRARPHWSVATLAGRLADERRRLDELRAGDREVRASFDLSYRELTRAEATLFRRLRLLPGPDFAAPAAAALLDVPGDREAVERLVERLVDAQLLEPAGADRYRFQDLIGLFASERLEAEERPEERAAALERALRFFLDLSESAAARLDLRPASGGEAAPSAPLAEQLEAMGWFQAERSSLLASVHRAAEAGLHEVTWRLAASLSAFFDLASYLADWADAQELAVAAARADGNPRALASALLDRGLALHLLRRSPEEVAACVAEALELASSHGWRDLEGRALHLRGHLRRRSRRLAEAAADYRRAREIYRAEGLWLRAAETLSNLALVHEMQGEPERTIELEEQSLAALGAAARDSLFGLRVEAWVRQRIGRALRRLGRRDEAAAHLTETLATFRRIGFRWGMAYTLRNLGELLREQGRWQEAAARFEESATIFRAIGDRHQEAVVLLRLGTARRQLQGREAALECWRRALATLTELRAPETAYARHLIESDSEEPAPAEPAT